MTKVEEEGKSDFGPWMLVRRRKTGPNSKGGRVGDQPPSPSPKANTVMTSGAYSHASKAEPNRSGYVVA